jgi:hypothetical protein
MGTVTGTRVSTDQAVQLNSVIGWTWRDRTRHAWHRLCAAVGEMNYVSRRLTELQMRLPR